MTDNEIKNCHYVSRFILQPWCVTNTTRPSVDYIDIATKSIDRRRIEKLFAMKNANSQAVERQLRDHIETPIGLYRSRIINKPPARIDKWELYAALRLLVLLQVLRFGEAKQENNSDDIKLAEMLDRIDNDPAYKAQIVEAEDKRSSLVFLRVPEYDKMFYPETGFFTVVFPKQRESLLKESFSTAIAIPFAPNLILMKIPKDADTTEINIRPVGQYSTAEMNGSSRYVIPPGLRDSFSDDEIIDEFFRLRQNVADFLFMTLYIEGLENFTIKSSFSRRYSNREYEDWQRKHQPRLDEIKQRQTEFENSEFGRKIVTAVMERDRESQIKSGIC